MWQRGWEAYPMCKLFFPGIRHLPPILSSACLPWPREYGQHEASCLHQYPHPSFLFSFSTLSRSSYPACLLNSSWICPLLCRWIATALIETLHHLEFGSRLFTSFYCHCLALPLLLRDWFSCQKTTSSLRSSSWDPPLPWGRSLYTCFLAWSIQILPDLVLATSPDALSGSHFSFLSPFSPEHAHSPAILIYRTHSLKVLVFSCMPYSAGPFFSSLLHLPPPIHFRTT